MRSGLLADRYFGLLSAPASHPNFSLEVVRESEMQRIGGREFAARCKRFAAGFSAAGVKPQTIVLIFLSHGVDLLPIFFGAQWVGAIPSYMPPLSPRQDHVSYLKTHAELIAHIEPALVIADPEVAAVLPCSNTRVLTPDELLRACDAEIDEPPTIGPEDIALLQHSSGTTGLKKGVALSYRAILAQIESYRRALEIDGRETVLTWLPVYHDMGLIACSVLPFVLGLPIVSIDPFEWLLDPVQLLELTARTQRPALIWQPNFAFHYLVRHAERLLPEARLETVKAFINCSEPCRPATFDLFLKTFAAHGIAREQLQTCYAMAENVFAVTQSRLGQPVLRAHPPTITQSVQTSSAPEVDMPSLLSCGRPIDGVEIEIRDESGELAAEGVAGEICLRGCSLFEGYFRQEAMTQSRIRDGWYHSRDIGFVRDGELYVCGRSDDLIIVAGRNLYAHDIETCASAIEGVKPGRSVAFGVDNPATGTADLVILVEASAARIDSKAIQRDVRTRIATEFLVTPAAVVVLGADTLVKTTSGKISRDENRRRYLTDALKSWNASAHATSS